jgi:hypothetical protein
MVDPKGSVEVCRRADDGSFPTVVTLTSDDGSMLTTPLLPGFSLAMSDLFAEI